jgi:hypothetical protein
VKARMKGAADFKGYRQRQRLPSGGMSSLATGYGAALGGGQ